MFKLTDSETLVICLSDYGDCVSGMSVSIGSYHYQSYLEWLDAGNIPEPIQTPEESEADRIQAIKSKAGSVITGRYPEWVQRNMLARFNELVEIKVDGGVFTTAEQTEYDALKAAWQWVKDVRTTSNDAETAGTALSDIVWPTQ